MTFYIVFLALITSPSWAGSTPQRCVKNDGYLFHSAVGLVKILRANSDDTFNVSVKRHDSGLEWKARLAAKTLKKFASELTCKSGIRPGDQIRHPNFGIGAISMLFSSDLGLASFENAQNVVVELSGIQDWSKGPCECEK